MSHVKHMTREGAQDGSKMMKSERSATHCNILQHTATQNESRTREGAQDGSGMMKSERSATHAATHYITLQHTAIQTRHEPTKVIKTGARRGKREVFNTRCNALQRTATHCNTLHHTATRNASRTHEGDQDGSETRQERGLLGVCLYLTHPHPEFSQKSAP